MIFKAFTFDVVMIWVAECVCAALGLICLMIVLLQWFLMGGLITLSVFGLSLFACFLFVLRDLLRDQRRDRLRLRLRALATDQVQL